jgi:hypothetical protein
MKCLRFLCYISISVLLLSLSVTAQESREWVGRADGTSNLNGDAANDVVVDNNGYVYVTGISYGLTSQPNFLTVKYNPSGDTVWTRRYTGSSIGYAVAYFVLVDHGGNVYVGGRTKQVTGQLDYTVIKYDPDGNLLWEKTYDGSMHQDDMLRDMKFDYAGNIYVTGDVQNVGSGVDYLTIKYSPDGDTLLVKKYDGGAADYATAVAADSKGYFYVTGRSQRSGTGFDYTTIKYQPNGDTLWVRGYSGPGNASDEPLVIAVDTSGYVYVTGTSPGSGTSVDYATVKYDPNGGEVWARRYNGPGNGNDEAVDLAVDNSGNVYVTGRSRSSGTNDDYLTIKYNSSGDTVWTRRYNGPGNGGDAPSAIALDNMNDVYVTGSSGGSTSGTDYLTIEYDPDGNVLWSDRYNGLPVSAYDQANAMYIDESNNIYVTGGSDGQGTYQDYLTIKYSRVTAVNGQPYGVPSSYLLSQNYPNPFNPSTTISYSIPVEGFVRLKLYDILGREVQTLVQEVQNAGNYKLELLGKDLASGIYFYRMQAGSFVETKKMLVVR